MSNENILSCEDLAEILNTTPAAIRMALHRGQEGEAIPPSFKLGNKRVWLRELVFVWLKDKAAGKYNNKPLRRRGKPRALATGKLHKDLNTKSPSGRKPLPSTKSEKGRE